MIQQVVLTDKAREDEEIKITFRTNKGLLRELKHYAADNDITVTDIINQACRDFLSKKAHK
jgi:hypothetical protein